MTKPFRSSLGLYIGFWAAGVLLMVYSYVSEPPTALPAPESYGHSYSGELRIMLAVTSVEMVIFALILRPWSYDRSWLRALLALSLLTPWLLLWGAFGIHAGPATHTHTAWLLLLWAVLAVSCVSSFRRSKQPNPRCREPDL